MVEVSAHAVQVNSITLVDMDESIAFSKKIRSVAENYVIEKD